MFRRDAYAQNLPFKLVEDRSVNGICWVEGDWQFPDVAIRGAEKRSRKVQSSPRGALVTPRHIPPRTLAAFLCTWKDGNRRPRVYQVQEGLEVDAGRGTTG